MVIENPWTLEKVLCLALNMEKESIQLYTSAKDKALNPASKQFLKELVEEEKKHENKLLDVMKNPEKIEDIGFLNTRIDDLKIVDWLADVSLSPEAGYQQILTYAAKREKTTHDLYFWLAKRYKNKKMGSLFSKLAEEELKHKYQLEKEYDDILLKEM